MASAKRRGFHAPILTLLYVLSATSGRGVARSRNRTSFACVDVLREDRAVPRVVSRRAGAFQPCARSAPSVHQTAAASRECRLDHVAGLHDASGPPMNDSALRAARTAPKLVPLMRRIRDPYMSRTPLLQSLVGSAVLAPRLHACPPRGPAFFTSRTPVLVHSSADRRSFESASSLSKTTALPRAWAAAPRRPRSLSLHHGRELRAHGEASFVHDGFPGAVSLRR